MKRVCLYLFSAVSTFLIWPSAVYAARAVEPTPNPIIVAKLGGNFTDPIAAVNSIVDASATNPYLIHIMPGVYDLGTTPLIIKDFVSIIGSGQAVTKINGSTSDWTGLIQAGSHSSLEDISIEINGLGSVAIVANSVTNFKTNNLLITSERNGIKIFSSNNVLIENTEIYLAGQPSLNGEGIYSSSSEVTIKDVKINSNIHTSGITCYYGKTVIENVSIKIDNQTGNINNGIYNYVDTVNGPAIMEIKNSKIDCGNTEKCNGIVNNSRMTINNVNINSKDIGLLISIPDSGDSHYTNVINSVIQGNISSVKVSNSYNNNISLSQLIGVIDHSTYNINCFNNYNENLAPIACP